MAGNKQQAKEPRAHLDLDQSLCDLGARARAKQATINRHEVHLGELRGGQRQSPRLRAY
jgi:hypothetical protein